MTYDVIVIGGGPAGLSGAVALARSLRSVLVIDAGDPRNARAASIHNYLTGEGLAPEAFGEAGRLEFLSYGGTILGGRVVSASSLSSGGFSVAVDDGSTHIARRLLLASGLRDELPDIPGLAEMWGRKVLHCPYCHGYEVRGQAIGVIGVSPMVIHMALLWRQLTPDLVVFRHTAPKFEPEVDAQLAARGIRVVEGKVSSTDESGLVVDGTRFQRDALAVQTRMLARGDLAGLTPVEHPMGIGTYIPPMDPSGRSSVPGVWVAGNVADPAAQLVSSAAAGMMVGAGINMDLILEETKVAVEGQAV